MPGRHRISFPTPRTPSIDGIVYRLIPPVHTANGAWEIREPGGVAIIGEPTRDAALDRLAAMHDRIHRSTVARRPELEAV